MIRRKAPESLGEYIIVSWSVSPTEDQRLFCYTENTRDKKKKRKDSDDRMEEEAIQEEATRKKGNHREIKQTAQKDNSFFLFFFFCFSRVSFFILYRFGDSICN